MERVRRWIQGILLGVIVISICTVGISRRGSRGSVVVGGGVNGWQLGVVRWSVWLLGVGYGVHGHCR